MAVKKSELYSLLFKSKYWYLLAFSPHHHAYRLYKLSRITQLRLTQTYLSQDLPSPPSSAANFTADSSALIALELHFKAEVAYRVYDEFALDTITLHEDGSLTVKTQLPDDR